MKRISNLLVLLLIAGLHLLVSSFYYSRDEAVVPKRLASISYDPRYRFFSLSPAQLKMKVQIPEEWIEQDLSRISKIAKCVRIYDVRHGMEKVPEIALKHSLKVIAGVDISDDLPGNALSVKVLIDLLKRFPNITSSIVGNEVILHNFLGDQGYVQPAELYRQIDAVRRQTNRPVSTAEPYNTWVDLKELGAHVDFISLNELTYWSKLSVKDATIDLERKVAGLNHLFPQKKVLLSEVGWPTGGPVNGLAIPGQSQMWSFLFGFLDWQTKTSIDYNYFEAFDQPWKLTHHEGRVGTQWGIFTAAGKNKLSQLSFFGDWVALSPALLAFFMSLGMTLFRPWLGWRSVCYLGLCVHCLALLFTWALNVSADQYLVHSLGFWTFIVIPASGLLMIVMTVLLEGIEAFSRDSLFQASALPPELEQKPFISIHVACCREPSEMVIATLGSLLALDYPAFEILVVDNNTLDPGLYEPVRQFCSEHADTVHFFHEDYLAGYKSGALNYALEKTSPKATIIAIVDSDYLVKPAWLRDFVAYFEDPSVAAIQAPQAYRNWEWSSFLSMIRSEYEGFFRTAMIQRNHRNAIIQHGTMLMLRREVLEKVGRWAEWCITEDTELGLRILLAGHRAIYVPQVYGEGLLPQSAEAYFKQRFRWVAGAMSIMGRYFKELTGLRPGLTRAQRYHFISGWLPWLVDSAAPVFTCLGVISAILCFQNNLYFPPVEFAYPFIFYFFFRLLSAVALYAVRVPVGWKNSLLANVAGMSLTWVIAAAVYQGLLGKPLAFYRTPKSGRAEKSRNDSWIWRLVALRGDLAIAFTLLVCAFSLLFKYDLSNREALVWSLALMLLALPLCSSAILRFSSSWYGRVAFTTKADDFP